MCVARCIVHCVCCTMHERVLHHAQCVLHCMHQACLLVRPKMPLRPKQVFKTFHRLRNYLNCHSVHITSRYGACYYTCLPWNRITSSVVPYWRNSNACDKSDLLRLICNRDNWIAWLASSVVSALFGPVLYAYAHAFKQVCSSTEEIRRWWWPSAFGRNYWGRVLESRAADRLLLRLYANVS